MVFFNEILPAELWFMIYKIEHCQRWPLVMEEIKEFRFNQDHMVRCVYCGLEWDGNAQCLCYDLDFI